MSRYRQHYDVTHVERRRGAAVDFLAVVACALLFGLPMFIYLWRM